MSSGQGPHTALLGGMWSLVWGPTQEQWPRRGGLGEPLSGPKVARVRCYRMEDGDLAAAPEARCLRWRAHCLHAWPAKALFEGE